MRDDPGAALREFLVEELHAPAHLLGGDDAFLLEQLLHRAAHDLVLGGRAGVVRFVVRMRVVVAHDLYRRCTSSILRRSSASVMRRRFSRTSRSASVRRSK